MSLLKSIKKIGGKLIQAAPSAIAGYATAGPAGGLAGLVSGVQASNFVPGQASFPGLGGISGSMAGFPTTARILTAAGGYAMRGARAITATAVYYCRRYPAWCSTIGGTAAVEALVRNGSLPTVKRRRRRGITARDLASFRRVANLVKTYSKPVHHTYRMPTKKCRT